MLKRIDSSRSDNNPKINAYVPNNKSFEIHESTELKEEIKKTYNHC